MPCDTGSETKELRRMFGDQVEWGWLDGEEAGKGEVGDRRKWRSCGSGWEGDGKSLERRAGWVRRWLKRVSEEELGGDAGRRHVVCVLHGGVSIPI